MLGECGDPLPQAASAEHFEVFREKVQADKEEPQAGDQGCENGNHKEPLVTLSPHMLGEKGQGFDE
jgi:hypothetical protein